MKKNLINRFAVIMITAVLSLAAANAFAAIQPMKMNFKIHPDTPYLAQVTIMKTGFADTPYLKFSTQPVLLNSQLKNLLGSQAGLFHVFIVYMNTEGEALYEEDYFIDNDNNSNAETQTD